MYKTAVRILVVLALLSILCLADPQPICDPFMGSDINPSDSHLALLELRTIVDNYAQGYAQRQR